MISPAPHSEAQLNALSKQVIGSAIAVHRSLGPGLNKVVYEQALSLELNKHGIRHERQALLPVCYKGVELNCGYRLDLVVESGLLLELKSAASVLPIHEAQLLTYLRLSGHGLGLLMNFNVVLLKEGVSRWVNHLGRERDKETMVLSSEPDAGSPLIAAAIEVHRIMGPGLLRSTYIGCLKTEFLLRGIPFKENFSIPVLYDGLELEAASEMDFVVEALTPLMICSVKEISPLMEAQFRSKLRLGGWTSGLLMNFNSPRLKDGLRMVGIAPQRSEGRKETS